MHIKPIFEYFKNLGKITTSVNVALIDLVITVPNIDRAKHLPQKFLKQ